VRLLVRTVRTPQDHPVKAVRTPGVRAKGERGPWAALAVTAVLRLLAALEVTATLALEVR
jgi:hypothetical protein